MKAFDAGVGPKLHEFLDRNLTIHMNHNKRYLVDTYFEEMTRGFMVDMSRSWNSQEYRCFARTGSGTSEQRRLLIKFCK